MTIDHNLLFEYEGTYKSEYYIINVEKADDQLVINFPWDESRRIYPESYNRFFINRNTDFAFSFLRDKEGQVNRLIYHFKGHDMPPFYKLESNASKYPDIDGLCGTYSCSELKTTYTVKIQNNRLVIKHLQNEDVQLVQIEKDKYIGNKWWFSELKLIRDENDKITGFRLNADSNNIQNLLFSKI